ncbi:MAG: DsbA family protein [Pseudanabaena sp. RU_4_16]|nr:DsbA family protein [Pseudanabaena sp. RU_4_16]
MLIFLVTVGVGLWLTSCAGSPDQVAKATPADPEFEAKVLEVIRKNPQVILESVQAYQRSQKKQQEEARSKVFQQLSAEPRLIIRSSPVTGATSQKIVMAEFSDFQCPFCSKAHTTVKQFMAKHQDKVTLVYKHLPLVEIHTEAMPAALASWAALQQGKFWEYHDALFSNQAQLGEKLYVSQATDLGLDLEKFNKDRQSAAAKAAIDKDIELAKSLGVNSTPTFFMNGVGFSGAVDLSEMEEVLTKVQATSK